MWFKEEKKEITNNASSFDKQILSALINNTDDAVIFYDTNFKILIFNKVAQELFELSADKVVGQQFSLDKAHQSSSKLLSNVMFPSLAPMVVRQSDEGVYPQVIDLVLEDPHYEIRIIVNRISDNQGQIIGFLKIVQDQTREKETMRSQEDFVTVAAHQLRTPATAVIWAFENLEKEALLNPAIKESVNTGHMAANNLMKIINDLLNISQIEGGRFGYQFQEIDLVQFINKLLAEAEPIAKEYGVKIYLDNTIGMLMVNADLIKLGIAVSNLIDNAIKYNIPNGQVTVKMENKNNEGKNFVLVSISDTGAGIPENEMKNLFNKFFRGSNVNQSNVSGSGLGLYITKNIIEKHGGKIWAESVLSRGTTFYFTLPLRP